MQRNIEIKARLRDRLNLLSKLKDIESQEINQDDTFYESLEGRLKLRNFGNGTCELIWYNRADEKGPKTSCYERLIVSEPKILKSILNRSMKQLNRVKKVRTLYLIGQSRIHVDSVENLGDFLEIEVVLKPEQTLEECNTIMNELKIK